MSRKFLYRIIATFLILLGIAIGTYLIPDLILLLKRTPYELLDTKVRVRNELWLDWFWQFVGWSFVYVIFRTAMGFYKDTKKTY